MNAELNARRTAAAAALADFHAAMVAFQRGGPRADHATWALRLEQHLKYVLGALDEAAPAVTLTPDQAAIVADALKDAEAYRMREAAGQCADCDADPRLRSRGGADGRQCPRGDQEAGSGCGRAPRLSAGTRRSRCPQWPR